MLGLTFAGSVFYGVLTFVIGLVVGSYMNVLVYRLPRGMSTVRPPSSCPKCNSRIVWYTNIPIMSYIALGGKCKDCGEKISIRYPIIEFITALTFLLVFLKFGATITTVKYCTFVYLLLAAAFTDLDTSFDSENFECGVIPDHYTIGGAMLGFLWALITGEPDFMTSLAGAGAGAFLLLAVGFGYTLVTKVEGLGMGDVLLMGMIGSFVGPRPIIFIITLSALVGSVVGLIIIGVTKNKNYMMPFGPMIAFAGIVYLFVGGIFEKFIWG